MRDRKGKSKYVVSERKCGPTAQWGGRRSDKAHGKAKALIAFLLCRNETLPTVEEDQGNA